MAIEKQIWIDTLMENFYSEGSFLSQAKDMSAFVDYDTINLAEVGSDPGVIVNNDTYPITAAQRTDTVKTLTLDTYDTESTIVRNVEAMELAYDKRSSVLAQHRMSLQQEAFDRAAHAIAPDSNTTNTPVITTTGADNGNAYKRLTFGDIATLKKLFDNNKYPKVGRNLVLCPDHIEDLILEDKTLFKDLVNQRDGEVLKLLGFNIFEYPSIAIYDNSTGIKKGLADAPAGTDSVSSFAFMSNEVMRAQGTIEMFVTENDPGERGDIIGFQMRFLAAPIRAKGVAAIYSDSAV